MMWSLGDYREVARMLEREADRLAEACGLVADMRVLDVAAGTGNFAVAAARRGAAVIASDFSPRMLEWGREHREAEGLNIEWREADAEDLPFADGTFDCCVSMFGAMFAPRPQVVAKELFRVTKSGGLVAMANWTREGFCGRLASLITNYAPSAPSGIPSPFDWAERAEVRDRFEGLASVIEMDVRSAVFEFDSLPAGRAFFEKNNTPTIAIRAMLPPDRYQVLADEMVELLREFNRGTDDRVVIDAEYLLVIAHGGGSSDPKASLSTTSVVDCRGGVAL